MPATKKQLAALKKAHAALKKKRAALKKKAKKPVKRRTVKKSPAKKATKRRVTKNYLYVQRPRGGDKYWFTGDDFDSDKKKAKALGHEAAMNAAKKYRRREKLKGFNFYYTGSLVKKPSGGRGKNPVPPSSKAKLKMASSLYEDFTGHDADEVIEVKVRDFNVGMPVGECDGVLYTTVRDGVTEKYIHKFKKNSRPTLVTSFDGRQLALIGGNFRFTDRGIEDR